MDFQVDAVYTWADGSDPDRIKLKDKYLNPDIHHTSSCPARWSTLGELVPSVQSVRTFLPWVKNIYILMPKDNKLPEEIRDLAIPVYEEDVMPEGATPTFNSFAKETILHKIPGLSEHFLYLNDDFFIGRPMDKSVFYTEDGKPKIIRDSLVVTDGFSYYNPMKHLFGINATGFPNWVPFAYSFPMLFDYSVYETWYAPVMNNGLLLDYIYGPRKRFGIHHQVKPVTKECYEIMWKNEIISPWLERTVMSRFRHRQDVYGVELALLMGLEEGRCVKAPSLKSIKFSIFDITDIEYLRKKLSADDIYFYCLNDNRTNYYKKQCEEYIELLKNLPHHRYLREINVN